MDFTSDNCFGAAPEILAAVTAENLGSKPSYGDDAASLRLSERFSALFQREVAVFPVISGTAANALALSTLVPSHGAILCHGSSHIVTDECGAVEFFSHGARLVAIDGANGKLEPDAIRRTLARFEKGSVHHSQALAVSLTNATELGTVYRPAEVAAIAQLARAEGLRLHMDGARFANAVASLGCSPADATWRAGVDVLSFGATKNGALGAEAVVFFDPKLAGDFVWRRKKAGHLISKMRFVAVQLEAYLKDDLWLRNAARANALARRLAEEMPGERVYPVEANEVFLRLPDATVAKLRAAGARFCDWVPSEDGHTLVRLVTSFATPEQDVAALIALARG